jgi:hypothetical protein
MEEITGTGGTVVECSDHKGDVGSGSDVESKGTESDNESRSGDDSDEDRPSHSRRCRRVTSCVENFKIPHLDHTDSTPRFVVDRIVSHDTHGTPTKARFEELKARIPTIGSIIEAFTLAQLKEIRKRMYSDSMQRSYFTEIMSEYPLRETKPRVVCGYKNTFLACGDSFAKKRLTQIFKFNSREDLIELYLGLPIYSTKDNRIPTEYRGMNKDIVPAITSVVLLKDLCKHTGDDVQKACYRRLLELEGPTLEVCLSMFNLYKGGTWIRGDKKIGIKALQTKDKLQAKMEECIKEGNLEELNKYLKMCNKFELPDVISKAFNSTCKELIELKKAYADLDMKYTELYHSPFKGPGCVKAEVSFKKVAKHTRGKSI